MSAQATNPVVTSASLWYKDGGSDKVYHAQIVQKAGGYTVDFQYGRRGQTMQTGTKTQKPVPMEQAQKTFDKLIKEKMAKGYTPSEDGKPYVGTDKAGELSGLQPQLLNFISEEAVDRLLKDDNWMMQEKKDGVRLMIRKQGHEVTGSNRKGLNVALSSAINEAIQDLSPNNDFVLDGEAIGDVYWAFDMIEWNGVDQKTEPALSRYTALHTVFAVAPDFDALQLVDMADDEPSKREIYEHLRQHKAEGVVFKRKDSKYVPGRPNSGGNALKYKFYATAICRVVKVNDKRSIQLGMSCERTNGTSWETVGNCTVPVNQSIPEAGDLVEVRYLYAFPGGSLFQPTLNRIVTDRIEGDSYNSLKFKAGTEDDEA